MAPGPGRNGGATEKLVRQSEDLRQQLLKMAARLEAFTNELLGEAEFLSRTAANHPEEHSDERREREPGS